MSRVTDPDPPDVIKKSKLWSPVRDDNLIQNVPNCNRVFGHVSQGNMLFAKSAECLKSVDMTHVLSLTRQKLPEDVRSQFTCKQIRVSDTPHTNLRQCFEDAFEFIEECKRQNGHVFIHCRAGVSRSSCITLAYMMFSEKMRLKPAYELLKEKRPIAHPNSGFLNQLSTYEKTLFGPDEQGINISNLGFTMWERTEHLGLNDPIPPMDLCWKCEKEVSAAYVERFGKNEFMTMNAGLGGKMDLHMVEIYSVWDFEWVDQILKAILGPTNAALKAKALAQQQELLKQQQAQQAQ